MITNETLVLAIGSLYDAVMTCSAPCDHDAVGCVLAILNTAILTGKEGDLEGAVHAWAIQTYPEAYADWQALQVPR